MAPTRLPHDSYSRPTRKISLAKMTKAPPASLHDRDREAAPGALASRLLPKRVLLAERESAGPQQFGQALPRRRRAIDPERQRLASGSGPRSRVAPIQRLRLERLG